MGTNIAQRHRGSPEWQRRSNDHYADRLVDDDGLEGRKTERPSKSGRRNSAPPKPIRPPSVPTTAPLPTLPLTGEQSKSEHW